MKRALEGGRYLALLAVVSTLIASAATFLWGAYKAVLALLKLVSSQGEDPLTAVSMIALMDKFLIAAGLYIFSVGMYELFIGDLTLPGWLSFRSLQGLKSQLGSIIILLMAMIFLERLIGLNDPQALLYYALSVAIVTAALIAFAVYGGKE